MKKRWLFLIAGIILIVIATILAFLYENVKTHFNDSSTLLNVISNDKILSAYFELGKQIKKDNQNSKVSIYVNSEPIYEKNILIALNTNNFTIERGIESTRRNTMLTDSQMEEYINELKLKIKTRKQITQELIEQKVLILEAKRLGLTVTEDEAKLQVEKNHEGMFENNVNSQYNETLNSYLNMIEGTGMTYEEYKNSVEIPDMQNQIIRQKLYEKFLMTIDKSKTDDADFVKKEYREFVDSLVRKAIIKYN